MKTIFALILCLFSLVLPAIGQAPAADPDAALAQAKLGVAAAEAKDWPTAIQKFQSAVALDPGRALYVAALAQCYDGGGQYQTAITLLHKNLPLFPALDAQKQLKAQLADTDVHWGQKLLDVSDYKNCIPLYEEAYGIHKLYGLAGVDHLACLLIFCEASDNRFADALAVYQKEMPALETTKLQGTIWGTIGLLGIGQAYQGQEQSSKAIPFLEAALTGLHQNGNEVTTLLQAVALEALGDAYSGTHQYEKAIAFDNQALAIERTSSSRSQEWHTLMRVCSIYFDANQFEKSAQYGQEAFVAAQKLQNPQAETLSLIMTGNSFGSMGRYGPAVESEQRALAIAKESKDDQFTVMCLTGLSVLYYYLHQDDNSILYAQQTLTFARRIKDDKAAARFGVKTWSTFETLSLGLIGAGYANRNQNEKALSFLGQALTLARQNKSLLAESEILNVQGKVYEKQGQYRKAVGSAESARQIARESFFPDDESRALNTLGTAYAGLGDYKTALGDHLQALSLASQDKSQDVQAEALSGLMADYAALHQPRPAIFFGKQAVNAYQDIRTNIHKLDLKTQKVFLTAHEDAYRQLAQILIAEGRLPEAQQVLGLLKEKEFFDFVRRDAKEAPAESATLNLTAQEAAWQNRYSQIADHVTALGQEKATLSAKASRTPLEEQRLTAVNTDLEVAGKGFRKFLADLSTQLDSKDAGKDKVYQIKEGQSLMSDLRSLGPGTVVLYTVVGRDSYSVILMTADARKAAQYPIKSADLNAKILAFRQALQNPAVDPRPLGEELYKILVGPVEKDLQQAGATTLMWSLDGDLRYLPVAALYDGKQYLVEKYRNTLFTPASETSLKDAPLPGWTGLGLGVSKAQGDFPALPSVPAELGGVIHETGTNGVLNGTVMLDSQFTEAAFRTALSKRYPVVHIASHFNFHPGDDDASFLLLGDGGHLTLATIEDSQNLFDGVELLTLSACNTAMGDTDADGKEVEGFGVLAQRQGAKAIIATLWPVADESTQMLMRGFYAAHQAVAGTSKAEALRQAQLSLLHGTTAAATASKARRGAALAATPDAGGQPLFTPDPKAPYAHPYFWAPFILIGNWR